MRIEFSKELLGIGLVTLILVMAAKGFYLGWFLEIQNMRRESIALTKMDPDQGDYTQRLQLLKNRLARAQMLKQKAESRWQAFSLGDLPHRIDDLVGSSQVKIQALVNEGDGELVWRLNLSGNADQLTRFLHGFENSGLPVVVTEATLRRKSHTEMELFFEVSQ